MGGSIKTSRKLDPSYSLTFYLVIIMLHYYEWVSRLVHVHQLFMSAILSPFIRLHMWSLHSVKNTHYPSEFQFKKASLKINLSAIYQTIFLFSVFKWLHCRQNFSFHKISSCAWPAPRNLAGNLIFHDKNSVFMSVFLTDMDFSLHSMVLSSKTWNNECLLGNKVNNT